MNQSNLVYSVVITLCLLCATQGFSQTIGEELEALTGVQTKLVWISSGKIKVLDSREQDERVLVDGGSQSDPLFWAIITPSGNQVVYNHRNSSSKTGSSWIIDWNGQSGSETKLRDNIAICLWKDPQSNREWAYFNNDQGLSRFALDQPSDVVNILDEKVCEEFFQVSADGKLGAGAESRCMGTFATWDLENGTKTGAPNSGCSSILSPDDHNRMVWNEGSCVPHAFYSILSLKSPNPHMFYSPVAMGSDALRNPRFAYNTDNARFVVFGSHGQLLFIAHDDLCDERVGWVEFGNGSNPNGWVAEGAKSDQIDPVQVHSGKLLKPQGFSVQYSTVPGKVYLKIQGKGLIKAGLVTPDGASITAMNANDRLTWNIPTHSLPTGIYFLKISGTNFHESHTICTLK